MLFLISLFGCAAMQVNLHGWPAYLLYPIPITETQLINHLDTVEVLEIKDRKARCGQLWGDCQTEVRVLRNDHTTDHLTLTEVNTALKAANFGNFTLSEQVDRHIGDHTTCYILVRVLPVARTAGSDTGS